MTTARAVVILVRSISGRESERLMTMRLVLHAIRSIRRVRLLLLPEDTRGQQRRPQLFHQCRNALEYRQIMSEARVTIPRHGRHCRDLLPGTESRFFDNWEHEPRLVRAGGRGADAGQRRGSIEPWRRGIARGPYSGRAAGRAAVREPDREECRGREEGGEPPATKDQPSHPGRPRGPAMQPPQLALVVVGPFNPRPAVVR